MTQVNHETVDVLLVGAGIMSATLAVLLKELDPSLKLEIAELRSSGAIESSNPWNNAGTGHAGLCELNYTPQAADGSIDIKKAVQINAQFEVSKQFWSHLAGKPGFGSPRDFINPVPHLSFVRGEKDVSFLKKRHELLKQHHAFEGMEYTEDKATMAEWMPLMMAGRDANERIAATRSANGTDVNFGALTNQLLQFLSTQGGVTISYSQKVTDLSRSAQGWTAQVKNTKSGEQREIHARFVFLGAGGGALPLLQMSGIPEGKGFGGFPVSGQWLICQDQALIQQHRAKVYSLAPVGAPPMSVPHLDTRIIDGKPGLLFGPYAGFTTRFLKHGSPLDLMKSVKPHNLKSLLGAGKDNLDLTTYLVKEALQDHSQRMQSLASFVPTARADDWKLAHAGKRVQIIKRGGNSWGKLEFGTEIVAAADGSLAALLGASPGASVSVQTMLDVLHRCFPQMQSAGWQEQLRAMIPSYGRSLAEDAALAAQVRQHTLSTLDLAP